MIYPTITEYIEAIRFSEDNFDKLTNLVPVFKDNGEPYYSSGNFAVVFKMKDKETGKLHAVKCFLKDQEGREESYRKISNYLETIENRYLIKTKFLEKELFVDSKSTDQTEFPVVVMDWVEGVPLDVYIREKINDKMYLEYLCYTFSLMAQNLIEQEFAHGDLKPDNILVKEDGMLVLVDYDGMYVPEMFGERSRELGSPDFQHPDRKLIDFDKHLDDFSLASILLSLKLISIDPSLLDKFGDKDRLLFSQKDYREFPGSEINAEIFKHFENKEVLNIYHLFLQALGRKMCVWNKEMWKLEVPYRENPFLPLVFNPKELNILEKLSDFDDDSKVWLAETYIVGIKGSQDIFKGLGMIFELAHKDNALAQLILGNCYYYGRGITKDCNKAVEWYIKSSDFGNTEAKSNLGFYYYKLGRRVPGNFKTALDYFSKSWEFGTLVFPYDFDTLYYCGRCCEGLQNWSKAFVYYLRSADRGNKYAKEQLADCYFYGKGVEKNYTKAVELYLEISDLNTTVQNRLVDCYSNGWGVPKDEEKAKYWYDKVNDLPF